MIYRRLDQGPKGRVERPSLHDRLLIVERRALHSALRAPVETTELPYAIALPLGERSVMPAVRKSPRGSLAAEPGAGADGQGDRGAEHDEAQRQGREQPVERAGPAQDQPTAHDGNE